VFDGVCVLCSGGASWLMRHDRSSRIKFTSAQSPLGRALYAHYGVSMDETYLLIDGGRAFTASGGYVRLCGILGGWWRLLRVGAVIPERLRDAVYALIARNRYRWFGRSDYCQPLTPEQRERLL
jgi:predicted DCC family thiol-disulfide oxidoreductase YuxK